MVQTGDSLVLVVKYTRNCSEIAEWAIYTNVRYYYGMTL